MTPTERAELKILGEKLLALSKGVVNAKCLDADPLTLAAQQELARRRSRVELSESWDIREVGWAILFDLYVMTKAGRRVSITSAYLASGAPQATASRHLMDLIDRNILAKEIDREDARRAYVRLTGVGQHLVENALRNAITAEFLPANTSNPRSLGQSHVWNARRDHAELRAVSLNHPSASMPQGK